jgi:hypothetical protein
MRLTVGEIRDLANDAREDGGEVTLPPEVVLEDDALAFVNEHLTEERT